ncbi:MULTISPECIES: hypothetical protein [unclassified Paenibacillus]|uniref:hypothetical protein n=1 Tax=unclassified Paenibacillus TaxID=185978 RepID=UPI0030F8B50B
MMIVGTILAILAAVVLTTFLGPYGILVLFAVGFGLLLSIHVRTKEIHDDMQKIKEKLGLTAGDDYVSDQEIEAELEQDRVKEEH